MVTHYIHRGLAKKKLEENTLAAFKYSFKKGYGIETDIHCTKDNKIICFHDFNLKNKFKVNKRIKDTNYNEIKKISLKFNSKDSLKIKEYSDVINDSKFLLCPNGYFHPETYRLYEALECGSIPIVENLYDYYDRLFPNNPLLKIKFWKEAKEIILSMNNDNKKLIEQSNICKNWWGDIKKKYQENFKLVIDNG